MSNNEDIFWIAFICLMTFAAVYLLVRYGWPMLHARILKQEASYERVLVQELLIDIEPRTAVYLSGVGILLTGGLAYLLVGGILWLFIGAAAGLFIPNVVIKHLEEKRQTRLEQQLVDSVTALSSGVRAGLNLVQSMEMIKDNFDGPVQQEFAQLLKEYEMGLDLNQAMRNAANRIGLSNYRLLFTAIEMHRLRGGDTGESLDRICESIREIQRLEGKLDALTAHGRTQSRMMGAAVVVLLGMYYFIEPDHVGLLFTEPAGRIIVLIAGVLIAAAFLWIRKIMAVDI